MQAQSAVEETKGPTLVSVQQFVRNVSCKKDLLWALQVKGKFDDIRSPASPVPAPVGQIFLPSCRFATLDFLKDILSGRKAYFTMSQVRPIKVPFYAELSMISVLRHANSSARMKCYLPPIEMPMSPNVDRNFLFTIVNTIDETYFPR